MGHISVGGSGNSGFWLCLITLRWVGGFWGFFWWRNMWTVPKIIEHSMSTFKFKSQTQIVEISFKIIVIIWHCTQIFLYYTNYVFTITSTINKMNEFGVLQLNEQIIVTHWTYKIDTFSSTSQVIIPGRKGNGTLNKWSNM